MHDCLDAALENWCGLPDIQQGDPVWCNLLNEDFSVDCECYHNISDVHILFYCKHVLLYLNTYAFGDKKKVERLFFTIYFGQVFAALAEGEASDTLFPAWASQDPLNELCE